MADGLTDTILYALVLVLVAILVVAYLELKYLRKSMKARRVRAAKRDTELPDQAHNALVTTKAIKSTLERGGIRSEEASSLLQEAQLAYDRRNYRVVVDLTSQAKDRLMAIKARQSASGDLAKLDSMPSSVRDDQTTTKELLQKEVPPNLLQSKFTMGLADEAISRGRSQGRDVAPAEALLAQARSRFDAKDYTGSLASARQAQRSADGLAVDGPQAPAAKAAEAPTATTCSACGASLDPEDAFCRKCGANAGPARCASCGASLVPGDAFCRKCGTAIP